MLLITELSSNACGLLLFYRHVCDPVSGHIPRPPGMLDSLRFKLPAANNTGGEIEIDKGAFLKAHRELRLQGLIEIKERGGDACGEGPSRVGEVYLVRDTLH